MIGPAADTALFLALAFGGVYAIDDLVRIGVSVWALKVLWEVVVLPLSLALIRCLKRAEGKDAMDADVDFNPFKL